MDTYVFNEKNEKMAVHVTYGPKPSAPVVLIEHGLAGFKEEGMIKAAAEAFKRCDFTVVTFDARFGLGDSDGTLEQANFTHFIEDLETLVSWVKTQPFYHSKLILCGHSLGAGACLDYAAHQDAQVIGVVSMAAVVSGRLLLDSYLAHKPDFVREWQKNRLLAREHPTEKERRGFISYAHMEDAMRYHLIDEMHAVKCPVLLIFADRDISSTPDINNQIYDALRTQKEKVVIFDASHTFKTPSNQRDIMQAIEKWAEKSGLIERV